METPTEQMIQSEVSQLLSQYKSYTSATKNAFIAQTPQEKKYWEIASNSISDTMKFLHPIIWFRYKYEAYAGTTKAIVTLQDLLKHSLTDDSICGKRLFFIDSTLKEVHGVSLQSDLDFSGMLTIPELLKEPKLIKLFEDYQILIDWITEEVHINKETGEVSKWHTKG